MTTSCIILAQSSLNHCPRLTRPVFCLLTMWLSAPSIEPSVWSFHRLRNAAHPMGGRSYGMGSLAIVHDEGRRWNATVSNDQLRSQLIRLSEFAKEPSQIGRRTWVLGTPTHICRIACTLNLRLSNHAARGPVPRLLSPRSASSSIVTSNDSRPVC